MAETNGYTRFFPYEDPYENQREAMDRIHNALTREQDVLFEGACGTGKTLAALVPALEYARTHDKTVVITTSVHQQMRQFVREAREITRQEPIRAVVFRGKGSMCHIDVGYEECQVLRDNTYEVVDTERDKRDLESRAEALLEESQAGDDSAAEARSAVMDELQSLAGELETLDEEKNTCDYYYNNLTADTDAFYEWLYDDVRTPDEIYEYAGQRTMCGYELLKDGVEGVDLVICNYHHLLDPTIREQFFRWLDRDPDGVVTVFDEAHNVEDAARDHATKTLTENTLDSAVDELEECDDPRADAALNVVEPYRDALVATYEDGLGFGGREAVGEDWEDLPVANDDGRDDLTIAFLGRYTGRGYKQDLDIARQLAADLDQEYEDAYRDGESDTRRECHTRTVATFLEPWMDEGDDLGRYPVVSVRRDAGTDEVYGRAELYTCIPREVTERLFSEVHASVLMSATLRPFDVTRDVLGIENAVELAYGLQFPEANRRTLAVETPALFASKRSDADVQSVVADALADAVSYTPGNVLVFFPSYAEAERYHERLRGAVDATRYLDRPGERAEELRERFVADDDAVLCTSLWGTLAEGVSFDGDDASAVVVVGVPYPHLDDRAEAVQEAYSAAFGDRTGTSDPESAGWRYAVEIPTVRKTRQALGRVIRAPEEVGARILLDKRYSGASAGDMGKYSVYGTFPPEERRELVDVAPEKLKFALLNFFSGHDAYGGNPPAP